jgi:hypothetical protein
MSALTFPWWDSLKHGGLLLSPSRLTENFPESIPALPDSVLQNLRKGMLALDAGKADAEAQMLSVVLGQVAGLDAAGTWLKGPEVERIWSCKALSGESLKPRWVWQQTEPGAGVLPVLVDASVQRLGIGKGRRACSRAVEWLRGTGHKVALITNLKQWRLVWAGLDVDAWVEWDSEQWLVEGGAGLPLMGLAILLGPDSLCANKGSICPLLYAIQESRKGQAELSAELGERVRGAVELLIQKHSTALSALDAEVTPRHIYLSATRMVMRMVVGLFAEARDLLPRDNLVYHSAYGLQGLREALERSGSGNAIERLKHRYSAWPRVIALFRLIHAGSSHEALPIPRYGGDLFAPGNPHSTDPQSRALAALEYPANAPADAVVLRMLDLLCRSRVKVRQGKGSTWVSAPVDFSDLSSEYIGILYEGLLDYELRVASSADPVVFLGLGNEPALNLSVLEAMDDKALRALVENMKASKASPGEEESEEEESAEVAEDASEDESTEEDNSEALPESEDDDAVRTTRERAVAWAEKAVVAGKLAKKPKGKKGNVQDEVRSAAQKLIRRIVLPREWFLVRWGGTRKGAGTFYTRPQLAVPTVQRTLRPLAYTQNIDQTWTPKKPEEILSLKVCDPAMGSGSFPVAALRFLTDALYQSLHVHNRLQSEPTKTLITLAEGKPGEDSLREEILPCRPDADDFEPRLRARLKRYVVEDCLYGVDYDPLAVELARLALWIETMDRDLPFEFLDHKIKCGNSLVGCWLANFHHYPAMAWQREGGDGAKGPWTNQIKTLRTGEVTRQLVNTITGQLATQDTASQADPMQVHQEALKVLRKMHRMPVHQSEERARYYQEKILANPVIADLKRTLDTWCAIWFWPLAKLDSAPMPKDFLHLNTEQQSTLQSVVRQYRFFHWELEFPDVFSGEGSGFDGMIGNPPWETLQPVSKEFFSNIDPLYRSYGNQEAKLKQEEMFAQNPTIKVDYEDYVAGFKAYSNWVKNAVSPFGDGRITETTFSLGKGKTSVELHEIWRRKRKEYANKSLKKFQSAEVFQYQGDGKPYTYKLFMELSLQFLKPDGFVGMIIPSGIYSDNGSSALRKEFLNKNRWHWIFSFENKKKIFDIHRSFKFCPVIVQKGGNTEVIQTAFMRHNLEDWEQAERVAVPYARAQVEKFSPYSLSILEIRGLQDIEVLDTIYSNSVLLGDQGPDGWGIKYAQGDFNMTSDSKLFPPRPKWEEKGYKPDQFGRWIGPDGDVALPLYEGRMVGQFDFSQKGWVSGKGRTAVWREIPWENKVIEPQYLMAKNDFAQSGLMLSPKVGQMRVGSATNARTMVCSYLSYFPCGDVVATLHMQSIPKALALTALMNSLVFDWAARKRIGGLHIDQHVIVVMALPSFESISYAKHLIRITAQISIPNNIFAREWLAIKSYFDKYPRPLKTLWAVTRSERARLMAMLEAISYSTFGLKLEDVKVVLDECDYSVVSAVQSNFDPKGFWRVDKDRPPELRHTVLSLVAFQDLQYMIAANGGDREKGIEAFCNQNNGEGWMLPETLCLADYGLGHDDRAKVPQPVASVLGPRFYDWQLEQSVEESWVECERLAREMENGVVATPAPVPVKAENKGKKGDVVQGNLF